MSRATGNQYASRKRDLLRLIHAARELLREGSPTGARICMDEYRRRYSRAPASTRRRWRCGQ